MKINRIIIFIAVFLSGLVSGAVSHYLYNKKATELYERQKYETLNEYTNIDEFDVDGKLYKCIISRDHYNKMSKWNPSISPIPPVSVTEAIELSRSGLNNIEISDNTINRFCAPYPTII